MEDPERRQYEEKGILKNTYTHTHIHIDAHRQTHRERERNSTARDTDADEPKPAEALIQVAHRTERVRAEVDEVASMCLDELVDIKRYSI